MCPTSAGNKRLPVTRRGHLIFVQRRERSLAATGLSNREIAKRLVMSVRPVEGHLFRASQRSGAASREAALPGPIQQVTASHLRRSAEQPT
jgi:DNA-binding NarL/FixJ family response regulator